MSDQEDHELDPEDEEEDAGLSEDEDAAIESAAAEEVPERVAPPRAQPAPVRPTVTRRRAGRPRKDPAAPVSTAPPTVDGLETRDAVFLWPLLLSEQKQKGYSADGLAIRVRRIGIGPNPSDAVDLGTIQGEAVCGNEQISAGDDLHRYIVNVYHVNFRGPAKYKLRVFYKIGARPIRDMELQLAHPDEIISAQRRAESWNMDRGAAQQSSPPASVGYGRPGAMPGMPGSGFGSLDPMQMFQQMRGMLEWYEGVRQQAAATGAPVPPQIVMAPSAPAPPPPPPAAPALSEEDRLLIEEGRFRRMAERLGYVPASSIPQAPTPNAQTVTQSAQNPVDGLRGFIKVIKEIDGVKEDLRGLFGGTEEDQEPADVPSPEVVKPPFTPFEIPMVKPFGRPIIYPQNVEGGAVEWAKSFFAANPETSVDLGMKFLGSVAKAVDGTSFGRVLEALAQQGGAAAAAAGAARSSGIVGTGAPPAPGLNGVPAVKHKAPSP